MSVDACVRGHQVVSINGGQWGDEGKGKLVDALSSSFDVVARCAGGNNAGHTVIVDGKRFAFHLLPSGLLHPNCTVLLGHGVVINIPALFDELKHLEDSGISTAGRVLISDRAHVVLDLHLALDAAREDALAASKLGTTRKGIGPAYSSKMARCGLRICDLADARTLRTRLDQLGHFWRPDTLGLPYSPDAEIARLAPYLDRLRGMIVDGVTYLHDALDAGRRVLVEGANATMLDIDLGTYPYVTSSSCAVGGACTGLGLPPTRVGAAVGIFKAYVTRVGAGSFPTELADHPDGKHMGAVGKEFGTTTGRPRRCGWYDAVQARYAQRVNGFAVVNLTKLDVLSGLKELKICVKYVGADGKECGVPASAELYEGVRAEYVTMKGWEESLQKCRKFEELPAAAQEYVRAIEKYSGVKIGWIGVGASRDDLITLI